MTAWRVRALTAALWVLPLSASPAEPPAAEPVADEARYPSLQILGFGDAGFSVTEGDTSKSGFFLGQFVLHFSSALSPRLAFFAEISVTTGGGGYGPDGSSTGGANADLHRSILKYSVSDALKLSIGRFHTPISYWNTAFHHGQWLQTTVTRPKMLDFSNPLLPLHFTGAFAEGRIPSGRVNLSYRAGIGNGRGGGPGTPEAPGDTDNHRAWLVGLAAKPEVARGLEVGGVWQEDRRTVLYGRNPAAYGERLWSGFAAFTREKPELLAECVSIRHRRLDRGDTFTSWAAYAQAAWRVSTRVKPYLRWEEIHLDAGDHVLTNAQAYRGVLAGVRLDVADLVAVKAEYQRRDDAGAPFRQAGFAQVSFTF